MSSLSGVERTFGRDELIVSKTDLKGHILYINDVFMRLAGYSEGQLIGAPHCIIRHPHMPHGVFRLLWDRLAEGRDVFAYIINRSDNGDHYWVLAHVTPSYDASGNLSGYHSSRRSVDENVLRTEITPLYEAMRNEEAKHANPKDKAKAGLAFLEDVLQKKAMTYDQFIFSLYQ